MKVARLILYEGDPEWLQKQLGRSMSSGKRELPGGNSITICTIGCTPDLEVLMGKDHTFTTIPYEEKSNVNTPQ